MYAFYECSSLESIIIPSGITMIEYCSFAGCENLETIYVEEGFDSSLFVYFLKGVIFEYYS